MEKGINGFLPVSDIRSLFGIKECDLATYSPLTLAFLGDAVFDLVIRTFVVEKGNTQVNKLHKKKSDIVKAETQKDMYYSIKDLLSEEEEAVFRRGRNAKSYTTAKNASVSDYRTATGLEALVGYLYLSERYDRVLELIKAGLVRLGLVPEEQKTE